ncbi:MAG: hypothetical protein LBF85_06705 [Tannerella sp.]|nr:hypothetical protein [Tannerella sp.]
MLLLSAMASVVTARHEAIQWADNKQIMKHATGNCEVRSMKQWWTFTVCFNFA